MEKIKQETFDQLEQPQLWELNEILLNTQEQCQMMERLIENQIKKKDELIDRLHKELEYYKTDQANRLVDAVMKEVIAVRRAMLKKLASPRWPGLTEEELRDEYVYLLEDITDLLERQNIDVYATEAGEAFDGKRHKAASVLPTGDPALDKRVAESVSEGYARGEKILIPEQVAVYRLELG